MKVKKEPVEEKINEQGENEGLQEIAYFITGIDLAVDGGISSSFLI